MPWETPGSVHLEKQTQIPRDGLLSELKIRDNLDLIRIKWNLVLRGALSAWQPTNYKREEVISLEGLTNWEVCFG